MDHEQIIKDTALLMQVSHEVADNIISGALNSIKKTLCAGDNVHIPHLGFLSRALRTENAAYIPGGNEKVIVPAQYSYSFTSDEALRNMLAALATDEPHKKKQIIK